MSKQPKYDVFLRALEFFHAILKTSSFGIIDMDIISKWVFENTPVFSFPKSSLIWIGVFFLFWGAIFKIIYIIIKNFMNKRKNKQWVKPFHEASKNVKIIYCAYILAIIHALVSTFGAYYCLIYADG